MNNRTGADAFNEGKTHIRHGSHTVQPPLFFHLHDDMLDHFFFIYVQMEGVQHQTVPLNDFAGSEPNGDFCRLRVVFDQVHDGMQAAVYRAP